MNRPLLTVCAFLLSFWSGAPAFANPQGGTVGQGTATFTSRGPQLNITTSDRAFIDWRSFNIGLGESTTFFQPASSSVAWNRINDPNPSQILGQLNANGLVVLQNQAGFFVGGQAAINVGGGLLMTTAPTVPSDFTSGGTWTFNGPPPAANIINYGQINAGPGSSIFLIARGIENHGTITAPDGNVGLYAGKEVLVSERPDGLGLSAKVTLPQGSVDNSGRIIADAGVIAMNAQVVNQGGLVQADSIREHNGVIELVATESLNLGDSSSISAKGDSQRTSAGGQVLLKSDKQFTDSSTSVITVAGGTQGGQGGQVEISATEMGAIKSKIDGSAARGYSGGKLILDPLNIVIDSSGSAASSGTVNPGDPPTAGTLTLNPASFASFSQITLQAAQDITLNTSVSWQQPDSSDVTSTLTLQAGNNITLNNFSSIVLGRNWSATFIAGADFVGPSSVKSGVGGLYLNGSSFVETQNGSITVVAGNEVKVQQGAIRTIQGGGISVSAVSGDVNTGTGRNGYDFSSVGYQVSASLGGISTAAGGDVTINAGRDIISYLPTGLNQVQSDAGSGAFGPEPGVVTVNAGRNVYGHFVAANSPSASQIIALTGNAGGYGNFLALSLVKGGWQVSAPQGSIYLQEARNPNGDFNNRGGSLAALKHWFNYGPGSFVELDAPKGSVHLEGTSLPRLSSDLVQVIYPPMLTVNAGPGGVFLGNDLTLFPSPQGGLTITTSGGGSLETESPGVSYMLLMSDSSRTKWTSSADFAPSDQASTPIQLNNPKPVTLDISGSLKDLNIFMPKKANIEVGGDMDNCTFLGQNLYASDVTSINVHGRIWSRNDYTFFTLPAGLPLVNVDPNRLSSYLELLQEAITPDGRPIFVGLGLGYNPDTLTLSFRGRMDSQTEALLLGPFLVKVYGPDGNPLRDSQGNFITKSVASTIPASAIMALFQNSQDVPSQSPLGYIIDGPGQFNITAGSIDLGVTAGILSQGPAGNPSLARLPGGSEGASIKLDIAGDLSMFSSTISSFAGGAIDIQAGGSVNLGSQEILSDATYPRGIFTSGHSDVSVVASGDINVSGSRIAAYGGGNVFVKSLEGNVNAGDGGSSQVSVTQVIVDPITYEVTVQGQPIAGSGIMATTLPNAPASEVPGNIDIETPRGNISSSAGGIVQDALNGSRSLTPTVSLTAGTRDANGNVIFPGNIDAGGSGVIGINTTLNAAGNITGLVVSRGNSDINAAANVTGTFFAAGTANFNAGGSVSGTVIAGQGINAGSGTFSATAFSQNVTVGGSKGESALASSASAGTTSQSASQSAQQDTTKQVAMAQTSDDDDLKKQQGKRPVLVRKVGRVTVILPPN